MTVSTQSFGYLEDSYLGGEYLTSTAAASAGLQMRFVIESSKASGVQANLTIKDFLDAQGIQNRFTILSSKSAGLQTEFIVDAGSANGLQGELTIADFLSASGLQLDAVVATNGVLGIQSELKIDEDSPAGLQALFAIEDFKDSKGLQYEAVIQSLPAYGANFRSDKYPTLICPTDGYLSGDYLSESYLANRNCLVPGLQANFLVEETREFGLQARLTIQDFKKATGAQARFTIVDFKKFLGFQFDAQTINAFAIQFLAAIYNTTNLRILCDFDSRGIVTNNWTTNSQALGDFDVNNVNTDIVEQVYRSLALTGVNLDSDTGVPQGTIIDTLAILGHNLTSSATVTLIGSNNSGHAPTGVTIPLEARANNMFHIVKELPSSGWRYYRIAIDDSTNPDGFLQIGTIVYGSSQIFQGECFVDEIEFTLKDFADTVATEGFTNVANSRSIKRSVRLDFRSLVANRRNFKILRNVFENVRTTLKCLWIPTPDPDDQEVTARFAAFGKLPTLPTERHNSKGPQADYVSLTLEVDESL